MNFESSQFDLVTKFKLKLKESNARNLWIFFIILCCEYILQILLHWHFALTIDDPDVQSVPSSLEQIPMRTKVINSMTQAAIFLHIGMLASTIFIYFFYPIFYRAFGNSVFLIVYLIQPAASGLCIVFMHGYFRMYYSKMMSMQIFLNMICCINAGVLTFRQCVIYATSVCVIYLFFHIYQYRLYILAETSGDSHGLNYISLPVYIIFFILSTIYAMITSYIHLNSEIEAFNNYNLGANTWDKLKDFVGRLVPKHATELLVSDSVVGDEVSEVTLLFADIVGFTRYSSSKRCLIRQTS